MNVPAEHPSPLGPGTTLGSKYLAGSSLGSDYPRSHGHSTLRFCLGRDCPRPCSDQGAWTSGMIGQYFVTLRSNTHRHDMSRRLNRALETSYTDNLFTDLYYGVKKAS